MKFKAKLWEHQKKAVNTASARDNFGLFFEVGTGKTLTAIKIMLDKWESEGEMLPTLIVAPPIVLENWRREIVRFTDIPDAFIGKLVGSGAKRYETLEKKLAKNDNKAIIIINYETLLMEKVYSSLMRWQPRIIIFDESHKLKSMEAKRTKAAIKLADFADYKYLLSGTPVLNSPMDLFSQYRAMDGGATFGKNFWTFRATFFYDKNAHMPPTKYFPDWRLKNSAAEDFNYLVNKTAAIAKKADCLDLPPLVRKKVYVDLSPEQERHYKELKKDLITFINDTAACTAPLALTKALRLQQIVSGFVIGEDMEGTTYEVHLKSNPRAKALEELLEELTPNHKIIVWAVFKNNYQTIRDICHKLSINFVELNGQVTEAKRIENIDAFNNDSRCRVLIGHPMSGGIGISLIASNISIYYSRNFSLEADIQSEARNYRGGSEIHDKVTRIDLVASNTIDEQTLIALENKQTMSDKILRTIQGEI